MRIIIINREKDAKKCVFYCIQNDTIVNFLILIVN